MAQFSNWLTNVSFGPDFARALTDVVMLGLYNDPELQAIHTVYPGMVADEKVPYIGYMSKVTRKYLGCGQGAGQGSIPASEKLWTPKKVRVWEQFCADDLEGTFWQYALARGVKRNDFTAAEPILMDFLIDQVTRAAKEDLLRGVWFNDVDYVAADLTNGAADLEFYNLYNGLFKQLFALGATEGHVAIDKNAATTTATQMDLPADYAQGIFRKMSVMADGRLRGVGDKFILATTSLVDNYQETLQSKNLESSFTMLQNGARTLAFNGMPVIEVGIWDRVIASDFLLVSDATAGTKAYDRPHRAVLTTKGNIAVGMDDPDAVNQLDVKYLWEGETLNIRGDYKADTKIPFDYLTIGAY